MAGWMTGQQAVGVPLSSVALDSASFVAQVCARTGIPDHALSACWPTVPHSTPMYLAEALYPVEAPPTHREARRKPMERLAALVIAGAIATTAGSARAQTDANAERSALAAQVSKLLDEKDSFVAIERIESGDDVKAIGRRYFYLVTDLYSQKKVAQMITIGRIGIHYLLTQSRAHAGKDEKTTAWFNKLAQMTSFNLAANLWPGWGDEGITITREQQAFGFDMARLDLRLAEQMNLPSSKLSTATWAIGIHHVAAGRYAEGKATLTKAREHAQASGAEETTLMVDGYIAIAEILEGKDLDTGRKRLAATKQALEKLGTKDAKFYAKQHEDVLKVLSGR